MFNPSATPSYMNPADRVRRQWLAFEQWVETVPRAAMEQEISQNFQEMDTKWNATPARTRPTRQEHDKSKAAYRKELEDGLVLLAREEWQRRLQAAGLRDEDWGEMTFKETLAAERLLGGDLDEEGMAIMEDIAREEDTTPALSNASRGSNFSGYSFVSPMSLSIADDLDDGPEGFESIYPFEIPASSGPASVASLTDEIFDTPTIPWGWAGGDASSYGIWSAATSQSSRQSSQTGSPERPPKPTLPDHALFPRTKETLPPHFGQHESRASASRAAHASVGPRYIGPQLTDPDEVFDDEAAFERFKMDTRVAKIREFHDEAALADIQLARDIYDVRKTRATETGRAEAALKIAEHETFMIDLRRRKEEERQAIVKAERHKRRQEIASRPAVGAESLKQRLTQEVESSLFKMSNGGFVGAPDAAAVLSAAEAETRRARRRSMTATTKASETPTIRKSDRLAASVSDLLETASTISFASSTTTTTASSTSTATSSSSARPQIWIPPTEGNSTDTTPVKPTKKKGGSQASAVDNTPTTAKPGSSAAALPAKPTKKTVPLPPVVDVVTAVPVAPKGPSPPAKTVVSSASNASSKASGKTQTTSVPAAGPSPPALTANKAPTPPVSKGASPPAAVTTKAPTPPVSKGPSPPVAKGTSPPVAKGPSPPVAKGPSPPGSKGPSPPVAKAASPPESKVPSPAAVPSKASTASAQAQSKVSASASASASTTKVPSPPVETPKPSSNPTAVPLKKATRVVQASVELETPGASSSRTTLEQMQRPFIHKSLGPSADLWMGLPPPVAAPAHDVWVSSSASANAKKLETSTIKITPGTQSTKIEKVQSMPIPQQPQPRLPLFAGAGRARRMSDPVSPSPRSFLYGDNGSGNNNVPSSKKGKAAKQGGKNKRAVTMEEVSDEEDAGPGPEERLPVDSKVIFEDSAKVIFEPKPSVPPTMFTSIIDFTSDTPKPPPPVSAIRSSQGGNGKGTGFLTADGKNAKEKHVRWTPSAMGNDGGGGGGGGGGAGNGNALRAALEGFEAAANAPAPAPVPVTGKGRRRTNSLLQQATAAIDRKGKGKGKERAVAVDTEPETEADFERFMMGATLDLARG